jgi:hypothetical protein
MREYGISNFIGDVVMTIITAGLWLLWVFIREIRGLRKR